MSEMKSCFGVVYSVTGLKCADCWLSGSLSLNNNTPVNTSIVEEVEVVLESAVVSWVALGLLPPLGVALGDCEPGQGVVHGNCQQIPGNVGSLFIGSEMFYFSEYLRTSVTSASNGR